MYIQNVFYERKKKIFTGSLVYMRDSPFGLHRAQEIPKHLHKIVTMERQVGRRHQAYRADDDACRQ